MLRPSWDPLFFRGTKVDVKQVKQPVLVKLHSLKCKSEPTLKDADDRAVKKIVAVGIIDPVIESIVALYASVYKVCSYLLFEYL